MRFRHPSRRALRAWLEAPDPGPIDAHVDTCDRCASRLENLASPVPELGAVVGQTLRPPDDLVDRLSVKMTDSMRNREDLQMFLELLGVSWRTVQTLMSEGEDT